MLAAPAHPYTRLLLETVPDPFRPRRDRLPLTGEVPNPINLPGETIMGRSTIRHLPITRDHPAEQRADRVARGERPARGGRVARDAAPASLDLGTGQPLPATERRYFERRLGADLTGVRIHPDAEAASRLRANAFAAGEFAGDLCYDQWIPNRRWFAFATSGHHNGTREFQQSGASG